MYLIFLLLQFEICSLTKGDACLQEIYSRFRFCYYILSKSYENIDVSFFLIHNLHHSDFGYTSLLSPSKNSANFSHFFRNKSIKLVNTADLFVVLCMHVQPYFTLLLIYCLLAVLFVRMYWFEILHKYCYETPVWVEIPCKYYYETECFGLFT